MNSRFAQTMKQLLKMQDSTNRGTIGNSWMLGKHDWGITIITELAEAIESSPYKWWKAGKLDLENIKVEIIDMLHFSLSLDMTRMNIEFISQHMREPKWDNTNNEFNQDSFIKACRDVIIDVATTYQSYNAQITTNSILKLASAVGMDLNEVRVRYIAKNALNLVRQRRGYKDGSYMKMWIDESGNEVEDNVWVTKYINQFPESDFESIANTILHHYDEMFTSQNEIEDKVCTITNEVSPEPITYKYGVGQYSDTYYEYCVSGWFDTVEEATEERRNHENNGKTTYRVVKVDVRDNVVTGV